MSFNPEIQSTHQNNNNGKHKHCFTATFSSASDRRKHHPDVSLPDALPDVQHLEKSYEPPGRNQGGRS